MIYSDGQLIFAFSKLREKQKLINHVECTSAAPFSGVHATNNQILGFFTLALANLMSLLVLQNWMGNCLLATYLILAIVEHCILESGKTH